MSKWSKISRLRRLAILMVIAYAVMGMARPQSTSATASTASGSTEVGGPISADTIWPLANSPYIVTKGVLIDHDVTLTIEAGVEIKINQGLGFRVDGTLIAKGTEDQRITFTANGDTLPGSWGFIHFTDPSEDAVFDENGNYAGGSILQYCSVRYGGGGEWTEGTIIVTSASPLIDHCKIEDSASHGIRVADANDVRISHNTIMSQLRSLTTSLATIMLLRAVESIYIGVRQLSPLIGCNFWTVKRHSTQT